ncbi:hypothetical protein G647_03637 [Cladophialophora carrionii CBS 160.54]|uniref:Transcription factor domain-containing protein n=1 Tax=Cladophialophora carrionii CBS 160.54 TaxID=1279043 RepID=V9DD70_9EURO|nr:uncharacterized protein G647_03637 [Cladophialophora carrionii CBS 160.54]ETI24268.1 hypothetical protein G647_03637 [Cladophialophora carrionii CBS 160.54]
MTAVECPRPLHTIFPSSAANKTQEPGRRAINGYKKIRWKKYDPSKKSPTPNPDPFVQWKPPSSSQDAHQEERINHRGGQKDDESKAARQSKVLMCLSPVEPLPFNGTRMNPFLALPIKTTETVQDTMDYFITICKGTNTDKWVSSGAVNPHLSLLLPYALKHAILFESIISVCRASILISLGRPIWEDYAFVQHRGSTIARLNAKLKTNQATDNAALLTVTMLMTLEYLCGNQRGVLMHCKGLERMLELRGPLEDDEQPGTESEWLKFVKLGLTVYKALGSFVTGQPPEAPRDSVAYLSETFQELQLDQPLSYPETPFSPDVCIILSRLPSGLSELCLTSQISIQMIKLLASISAATALLATEPVAYNNLPIDTWTPSPSFSGEQDLPLPAESSQLDEQRKHLMIQTILSSLQRMSLTTNTPIEYHLTSGLLSFLFQLRDLGPINLFYDPILRKFITTLPTHTKPTSLQEQSCFIWASMAVAGTLALRVVPMPDSHLVMDHCLELYPQARSWARLDKILRTYFFTDEIGAHWRRVWQRAMNRREFLLRQRRQQVTYTDADLDYNDVNDGGDDAQAGLTTPDRILNQLSVESPAGFDMNSEAIRALVQQHIAGAPRSVIEMSQAMGLCPLRSRWASAGGAPSTPGSTSQRTGTATTTPSPRSVSTPVSPIS